MKKLAIFSFVILALTFTAFGQKTNVIKVKPAVVVAAANDKEAASTLVDLGAIRRLKVKVDQS